MLLAEGTAHAENSVRELVPWRTKLVWLGCCSQVWRSRDGAGGKGKRSTAVRSRRPCTLCCGLRTWLAAFGWDLLYWNVPCLWRRSLRPAGLESWSLISPLPWFGLSGSIFLICTYLVLAISVCRFKTPLLTFHYTFNFQKIPAF